MRLLDDLARTRDDTLHHFALGPADLERRYAPGKWSVRELLCHLADAETVLFDRIRRCLCEPRSVLWAFDQDAWALGTPYHALPLELSRDLFAATRASVMWYVERHYEAQGQREFVHSTTGVRTLKDEMEKVAWHNAHHLAQIRAALNG
jgi:hypothetical protein